MKQNARSNVAMKQPNDVAAALRYDPEKMNAPEISAIGERQIADLMRRVARRYGVEMIDEPELASDLSKLKIAESIPHRLYEPVAAVLAKCRPHRPVKIK